MEGEKDMKTVIITGAANGIGKGIAQLLDAEGYQTILLDCEEQAGQQVADELEHAHFYPLDLQDEKAVRSTYKTIFENHGIPYGLINNAGISKFHDFFELSMKDWQEVMQTNLTSVFLCSQLVAAEMKDTGGVIINMASTRSFMSEPDTEAYAASKGGITALTHALARTLGPYHIRVNSIAPGWIATGGYDELREVDHSQHLSGRVGKPSDIARVCSFLLDERNDFITAETITVDGGMTRKMIYEH